MRADNAGGKKCFLRKVKPGLRAVTIAHILYFLVKARTAMRKRLEENKKDLQTAAKLFVKLASINVHACAARLLWEYFTEKNLWKKRLSGGQNTIISCP